MKIFAQAPPGASPSPETPTMPTSGGPGPGGPSGPGPEEGAPPAPVFKIIYSPLDNIGKILADLDFKSYLEGNFGDDPDTLAHKVWVMYGGPENEIGRGRPGERKDTPSSNDPATQQQQQEQEYNATRNARWKRLPLGVSIDQITSTEALSLAIRGGFQNLAKATAKPPTPAFVKAWLRLAEKAELKGNFKQADCVDRILEYVYTLK